MLGTPPASISIDPGQRLKRQPRPKYMVHLTFRIDQATAEQLRELADREDASVAHIVRRLVRDSLRPDGVRTASRARAREGAGRVR